VGEKKGINSMNIEKKSIWHISLIDFKRNCNIVGWFDWFKNKSFKQSAKTL